MDIHFRFTNYLGTYIVQFKDISHLAKAPASSLPYPYEIVFDPNEHNFNLPVHATEILPLIEKIKNTRISLLASTPSLLDVGYHELAFFEGDSNAVYRWGEYLEPGWGTLEAIAEEVIRISRIANRNAFSNIPREAPDQEGETEKDVEEAVDDEEYAIKKGGPRFRRPPMRLESWQVERLRAFHKHGLVAHRD